MLCYVIFRYEAQLHTKTFNTFEKQQLKYFETIKIRNVDFSPEI